MSNDYRDPDRAAILDYTPEPSPARIAALRALDRAYERVKADALARYNARLSPAPASPDPGGAPAAPPLADTRADSRAAD